LTAGVSIAASGLMDAAVKDKEEEEEEEDGAPLTPS
jgi:hypothetical protein